MRSTPHPIYLLLHKDYYETLDAYPSGYSEFCDLVSARLPPHWRIERRGIWAHCISAANVLPIQGWKIHISARLSNALDVLSIATEVLFKTGSANFKFAVDTSIMAFMNSKNWPRGEAGKFLTVYPPDNCVFVQLMEELYQATKELHGPYILSDYRYKDSRVVFYRYGGMRQHRILNIKGEHIPVLISPEGNHEPDRRLPYPVIPQWAETPLPVKQMHDQLPGGCRLKEGKYRVDHVISFSNAGGVYCAVNNETGMKVIIKEARPGVNEIEDGYDAVELLKKEYRILAVLADTAVAPQPIELFQEWEHWFLVEEYIEGLPVNRHMAEHNVLLRTRVNSEHCEQWWQIVCALARNLTSVIDTLHERAIIFGDLSPRNLLVTPGETRLKLIDFEAACQIGIDRPTTIHTPGFASPNRVAGCAPQFEDDYYGAGAVLLSFLFPINTLLSLQPEASREFLRAIQTDAGLPNQLMELILDLLNPEPARRPCLATVHAALNSVDIAPGSAPQAREHDYLACLNRILLHIENAATYDRRDRLFPADPKVFATNPLSLGYGASGIIYALGRITGKVPQPGVDWILSHEITAKKYPPGLYLGLSGIAWSLLETGHAQAAENIFRLTFDHQLLNAAPDVFYGLAGWGMTCLRFFLATGNQLYFDKARHAASQLLEMRKSSARGAYWGSQEKVQLGFAHGASGIGLFLLHLYLLTSCDEFLAVGEQGLRFDLSFGTENKDGGLSWASSANEPSVVYPYWRFGSAGIGAAVLRFWHLLRDPFYFSILEKIFIDTDRKYAILPGRFLGLAGIGDFLLDMHGFTGNNTYLESAHKVAEGIMLFRVEREGIAFPGDLLCRLCCDYGTGSGGIGLFLARLQYGAKADFMLDSLFENKCIR